MERGGAVDDGVARGGRGVDRPVAGCGEATAASVVRGVVRRGAEWWLRLRVDAKKP